MSARDGADRIAGFTESVIREMTRLADTHGAVNLAQGFPDFPAPDELKAAAIEAIAADRNQYSITWGARDLRAAVAARYRQDGWPELDPESEITITCGSTEAMASAFLALVDHGSEVSRSTRTTGRTRSWPRARSAPSPSTRPTGASTPTSSGRRSPRARARSSSTRPTTRPARSSTPRSWRPSRGSASNTTCSPSPTRSTSGSPTTARLTASSPCNPGWANGPSPSAPSPRPTR